MATANFNSLTKTPLRKDWDASTKHTNEVELLEAGYGRLPTLFVEVGARVGNLLAPFTEVQLDFPDLSKGWGLEIIGYDLPYNENRLDFGDHMIAKVHHEIPQIKLNITDYYAVRSTYTIWHEKKELMDPARVSDFYAKQLRAFGMAGIGWFKFLSYMIFTQLEKGDNNNLPTFDAEFKDPYFEQFRTTIFSPTNGSTNGYPFYAVNLSLEKTPAVNSSHKTTQNQHETLIKEIRKKITTNKEEYQVDNARYAQHDIPQAAKEAVALREKIAEIAYKMLGNTSKYRLTSKDNDTGFILNTKREDLICYINPLNQDDLDSSIPKVILPETYRFNAEDLRVGQVVFTPCLSKGTALIIHKDALKFIMVRNKSGSAEYPEHEKTNIWHAMGYFAGVMEIFPCVFIKKKA